MVEFRFRLGLLVGYLLLPGLVLVALVMLADLFIGNLHVGYDTLLVLGAVVVGASGLSLVQMAPPLLIRIDQAAGTVQYRRLFRGASPLLVYQHVRSEFRTRRQNARNVRGWSLTHAGDEQLFVEFDSSGWTEADLQAVHEHLRPMLP